MNKLPNHQLVKSILTHDNITQSASDYTVLQIISHYMESRNKIINEEPVLNKFHSKHLQRKSDAKKENTVKRSKFKSNCATEPTILRMRILLKLLGFSAKNFHLWFFETIKGLQLITTK